MVSIQVHGEDIRAARIDGYRGREQRLGALHIRHGRLCPEMFFTAATGSVITR
jgi:hypothetical protein